jgi:dienelactone hydrolase
VGPNLGIDRRRIGAFGVSSGGHLALHLALADDRLQSKVACCANWYGPCDITDPRGQQSRNGQRAFSQLVGQNPIDPFDPLTLFVSPVWSADETDGPIAVWFGEDDTTVPPGQHVFLPMACTAAGVPISLTKVPDTGHGFSNTQRAEFFNDVILFFALSL